MLGIKMEKLLGFTDSKVCEHCGISSEATLCSDCHSELKERFDSPTPTLQLVDGFAEDDNAPKIEEIA